MDEKRYEELIQKRESSGLTALEADELGRLMAEKESRQYGGSQARATAGAAEEEASEEERREDAPSSSEIIEAEREGEAEKR